MVIALFCEVGVLSVAIRVMLSLQEQFFSKLDSEKFNQWSVVLYCTVPYCTVLYCTALHCTVLYCTVLYCTVPYRIALHSIVLYCIVLYCIVSYRIVSYRIVSYRIVSYRIVSFPYVLFGERFAAVTNKHTNRSGLFMHIRGLRSSMVYVQFLCANKLLKLETTIREWSGHIIEGKRTTTYTEQLV